MTGADQKGADHKRAGRKGLTLIETMIVVAIIGIVISVAMPAWQDHSVRVKLGEAAHHADAVRAALGTACLEGELTGADNASLGLEPATAYSGEHASSVAAAGVSSTEGTVTITLESIDGVVREGQTIVFTGACSAEGMRWTVSGSVLPKYLPKS